MTDHDPHDPHDPELLAAGQRLRHQGPDDVASRQALAQVKLRADAPPPARRSWWPALIGAGLAAAAVVGVLVIRSAESDTDTIAPVQTEPQTQPEPTSVSTPEPTTTPVPSTTPTGASVTVDAGCITVTAADRSATGCPQNHSDLDHLDQRTFVADLGGPVLVTSRSSDPLVDLTVTIDNGAFASRCRWNDLAPHIADGAIIELVVCDDTGVMGVTTGRDSEQDWAISYFTLPTPYFPDGAELGLGTPIPGLPGALAFSTPQEDVATCSILLLPDRSGWKEACGFIHDLELATALVQIDPTDHVYEVTVDAGGLISSAQRLDAMAPSSGCSIESADDLVRVLPGTSIVMGMGCIGDQASMTTGSVLVQDGPPDGSIWLATRGTDGGWAITDNGTGIDDIAFSFPVVPRATWSRWPDSTVPGVQTSWSDSIIGLDTQPDIDTFADALVATLAERPTDPEFPLNERIVEVQPNGLPLIVAQADIGGDDSVGGAVLYVWLDEVYDDSGPIGWRAAQVLVGNTCLRGIDSGSDLCV